MNCPTCLEHVGRSVARSRPSLRRLALLVGLLSLSISACSDDDPDASDDAGVDGAVAETDGGESDAGAAADGGSDAGSEPFGPCETDKDCPDGTFCDPEIARELELPGSPSGAIDQALFPGGSCSPKPLVTAGSAGACDSTLPQPSQGCGTNGACVLEAIDQDIFAACRPACEPSAADSGCERPGYTCDFGLSACIEGCRSDAECRVQLMDGDRDGAYDSIGYDGDSQATCDARTARCTHPGAASVETGSACERLDDCASDGQCLQGGAAAGLQFPGGYCTVVGCDVPGRECQGDSAVCEPLRPLLANSASASFCLTGCEVGAEPEEARLGADGHGSGCRPGYRCHYNGGAGAESGVCVGGVYNDITTNNIGDACSADSECYSPFGLARCLRYTATAAGIQAPSGMCTLLDCNAPGIPSDVCGARAECITFTRDVTFCIPNCGSPDECADGFACTDDDGDPSSPRVCYPACSAASDCRNGQRCQIARGQEFGACVASTSSGG